MAIKNYTSLYGYNDNSTPHDLAMHRRHVWEYMSTFGMPVIHAEIYNTDDVTTGTANWDTTYDDVYGQGLTFSGQDKGYGAGFGPTSLTYITFGEAEIDDQTPNRPGAFKEFLPNIVAPWVPYISDGDLLIQVSLEWDDQGVPTIIGLGDRFQVQDVHPVPLRSFFNSYSGLYDKNPHYLENLDVLVCQNMNASRIPKTNPLYEVPIDTTLEET